MLGLLACSYQNIDDPSKINGLCLVAPPFDVTGEHYKPIRAVGANWVAVIPYAFCSPERPEVTFDHPRQWVGEKTAGIRNAIELAKRFGLKVMLKPHLWVLGQGWAGDLQFDTDSDLKRWQDSYMKYLIHFSKLAEEQDVELVAIGTEIRILATSHPAYWQKLITEIKAVYSGKITYAANWDNYQYIGFWDQLDYIGIDAYFPSIPVKTPEIKALMVHNDSVKSELKKISDAHLKKVLFTEFGFRSVDYCAAGHWKTLEKNQNVNGAGQANAYQAFFNSYWNESWIAGGFAWKWHYNHLNAGGDDDKEFTPQNKKAEKILRTRYTNNKN